MAGRKIVVGKISEQQEKMKGWLAGQFFPDNSPFKDEKVEIYLKVLTKEGFADKLHYHPFGKEYLIVLAGKIKMQIGEETIDLKTEEYFCILANEKDKIIEFEEGTQVLGVRTPSVKNNKVFLE